MILMSNLLSEFHESFHDLIITYDKIIRNALNRPETIYPPRDVIFRVFQMDVRDIKVAIIGQDPYHGKGQATGLAFECNNKLQPSLRNMFQEIKSNFPERNYKLVDGNLGRWNDEEHIFLLNTALTVRENEPGSLLKEWQAFTNAVIQYIHDRSDCVFLLMGKPAQTKEQFIEDKSRIIKCVHPSPLSAYRGFFDSKVFLKIEEKVGEICWETEHKTKN
jgi:uracil-DNA glycosylase